MHEMKFHGNLIFKKVLIYFTCNLKNTSCFGGESFMDAPSLR